MKAELNIPDDLARDLERRAKENGRATGDELLDLIRLGMLLRERAGETQDDLQPSGELKIVTDPKTGLPVIQCPLDAPIRNMTSEQIQALYDEVQLEEDLIRAGITPRH